MTYSVWSDLCLTLSCGLWHVKCRQEALEHTLSIMAFRQCIQTVVIKMKGLKCSVSTW